MLIIINVHAVYQLLPFAIRDDSMIKCSIWLWQNKWNMQCEAKSLRTGVKLLSMLFDKFWLEVFFYYYSNVLLNVVQKLKYIKNMCYCHWIVLKFLLFCLLYVCRCYQSPIVQFVEANLNCHSTIFFQNHKNTHTHTHTYIHAVTFSGRALKQL